MAPPEQNNDTWDKLYQFLFGRGVLGKAQGPAAPAAPAAGGNVAAPVPGMGGKSMADLAKEAAERSKKAAPKAKPAAKPAGASISPQAQLLGPGTLPAYSDEEIARVQSGRGLEPDAGDAVSMLLGMLGGPGGGGAGAQAAGLVGKVKRFNVDAKALSMPEVDTLLTRAAALGNQVGPAAQRLGQQINNVKRTVFSKAIADPTTKWSVQDILNMLSESTAKGSVKKAVAEYIDNPAAQIEQGGRLYPLTQEAGKGLRGWWSGK